MFYFRHREKKLKTYLEFPPGATLLNIYLEFSHNTGCCRGVRCVDRTMARIEMGGDTQLATLWQPGLSAIIARSSVLKSNNYQLLTVTALELETKVREERRFHNHKNVDKISRHEIK